MKKTGNDFDPDAYAPVAERIRLFYRAHPLGRIETELVRRSEHEVLFKALVFRDANDAHPAATGWAAEREGDSEINMVACLENTETSAIGRALANLGFTASRQRPSAEEMAKASRARARSGVQYEVATRVVEMRLRPTVFRPSIQPSASVPAVPGARPRAGRSARDEYAADLLALLERARSLGLRPARMARWREHLLAGVDDDAALDRWQRRLRAWVARERAE